MSPFRNSESMANSRPYIKSGIGGAGNIRKSSEAMRIHFTPSIAITQASGVFSIGIGGAGNVREGRERAVLTPEEIISRSMMRRESASSSYHTSIGGAGNRSSSYSDDSVVSLSSSGSSNTSTRRMSGANKLKEKFGNSKASLLQAWQRPADTLSLSSYASEKA